MAQTQQQAAQRIGRAAACLGVAWLLRHHTVWVAELPDAADVDAVVIPQNKPERRFTVQFKMAYRRKGTKQLVVNLARSDGRRYAAKAVDVVLAVDPVSLTFWVLPVGTLRGRSRIVLGKEWVQCAYTWDQGCVGVC